MKKEDYRPKNIEFDVNIQTQFPASFGTFKNADEVQEFMSKNFVAINQKITASRFMDNFEKNEIRKEYIDLLELKLPLLEKDLQKALFTLSVAKEEAKDCQENVNATQNEVKALASEVKLGLKDVVCDDLFTWKVPYKGKFYVVTYIENELKVCKVLDIQETEKMELYSSSEKNEQVIETNFAPKSDE